MPTKFWRPGETGFTKYDVFARDFGYSMKYGWVHAFPLSESIISDISMGNLLLTVIKIVAFPIGFTIFPMILNLLFRIH